MSIGVVPLAIAVGAGAEMRRPLGIAVFSGMLGVTFFGIFLTPVFYYVLERLAGEPRGTFPEPPTMGGPSDDGQATTPHRPADHELPVS